jgi:hypothetical protein
MRSSANSFPAARPVTVGFFFSLALSSALAGCGGVEPATEPAEEATPTVQEPLPVRMAPEPRLATPAEVQRHLQQRAEAGLAPLRELEHIVPGAGAGEPHIAPGATPTTLGIGPDVPGGIRTFVTTPGALPPCMVNFNSPVGISMMADQAYTTFTSSPHYQHWCNNNGYLVRTWPISISHYHLAPEAASYCIGTNPKIGTHKVSGVCMNQTDGKNWPRVATNMGGSSGVEFWVKSAGNVGKNFDFRSIDVRSGSVEVWVLKSNGWHFWTGLVPAHWTFPNADNVGILDLFASGKNGTISYDNVEVAVIP